MKKKKLKYYPVLTDGFEQANQREEEYKNQIKTLTNRLKEVFCRTKQMYYTHRLHACACLRFSLLENKLKAYNRSLLTYI